MARTAAVQQFRARWERSYPGRVAARINAIDGMNQAMLLGANGVLTLLPFFVLLGALASHHIDDDIELHMGLDHRAAVVVDRLFAVRSPHFGIAIVIAVVMLVGWTLGVVSSLQGIYERIFALEHRGFRDIHRFVAWVVALCFTMVLVGASIRPIVHVPVGAVLEELTTFALITPFIWWTMHFLLGARVPWRDLIAPAIGTGIGVGGLGLFSHLYFSSTIVSDSHLYGSIGAVFSLVTWIIAVATIVVIGAVAGDEWNAARRHTSRATPSQGDAEPTEVDIREHSRMMEV